MRRTLFLLLRQGRQNNQYLKELKQLSNAILEQLKQGLAQVKSDLNDISDDTASIQSIVSTLRNKGADAVTDADLSALADAVSDLHSSASAAHGNLKSVITPAPVAAPVQTAVDAIQNGFKTTSAAPAQTATPTGGDGTQPTV